MAQNFFGLWERNETLLPVLSHKTNPERNSDIYCLPSASLWASEMQFLSNTDGVTIRGRKVQPQQ